MMTLRNSYTAYNKLLLGAILNLELKVSGDVLSLSQYLMSDFYYFFSSLSWLCSMLPWSTQPVTSPHLPINDDVFFIRVQNIATF